MLNNTQLEFVTGDQVQPIPRVVLLGDPDSPEFAAVEAELCSVTTPASITSVTHLGELDALLSTTGSADLIVVAPTWSDEFSFAKFVTLPGIGHLTKVICCRGAWCASDGRSRQDWPLSVCVPFENFQTVLDETWQQLRNDRSATATRYPPWTAGRDEIFRARTSAGQSAARHDSPIPIRIVSPDRSLCEMYRAAFQQKGWKTTDVSADGQLVLWDIDPIEDGHHPWQDELASQPNSRVVALTGFADVLTTRRLIDAGAIGVISKLLPLKDLVSHLDRI